MRARISAIVSRHHWAAALVLAAASAGCAGAEPAPRRGPIRFEVRLSRSVAPRGASGRLLVFMSRAATRPASIEWDFAPSDTWVAAMKVERLLPGQLLRFDPDRCAYPRPFSEAGKGTAHFMAFLDTGHSYAYFGPRRGGIASAVVTVPDLDAADAEPIALSLDRLVPRPPRPADTPSVKLAALQSPLLSAFWGRPITVQAGVVLPPAYAVQTSRRFPTVYHVHGFGGDVREAWEEGPDLVREMANGRRAPMVHVFLDASCPTGHHVFADSVNNGPWGRALVHEFIPFLERRFRLIRRAPARFLTGHSSGGWSTLWLQITYPDVFGGVWSTAPDPVDLRRFTGVDATPGSHDNLYRKPDGSARNLVRVGRREVLSVEQWVRQEGVLGEYGGQFASFEWVWSPRGQDGRPMRLFNRVTGEQDPQVQRYWQRYDIRRVLETRWPVLAPKLRGKLHIFCGSADTFHLNEAAALLFAFLRQVHSDAVCEMTPGRNHFDLYEPSAAYPKGLEERIDREMWAAYRRTEPGRKSRQGSTTARRRSGSYSVQPLR